MTHPEDFYEWHDQPSQGDIVLCGASRIIAQDRDSPPLWGSLDAHLVEIDGAWDNEKPLAIAPGIGLAMVLTHDCQLGEELNKRVRKLKRGGTSTERARGEEATDTTRDRTLLASPLVDPSLLHGGRGSLLAGRGIRYLPVLPHPEQLPDECVVDLNYQRTGDHFDVVKVSSITEAARKQLRYVLIRLDALRTAALGFEVEAIVGRTIHKVDVPKRDPLTVHIQLDDGEVTQLLQPPGTPRQQTGRTGEFFSPGGSDHA